MTVLITGADGSVGTALRERLDGDYVATDIDLLDVTDGEWVRSFFKRTRPSLVYHLAGAKHAPQGEIDPAHVARVNITGTLNVLNAAELVGAKVVLASTCKACDPETAYGASKLIAERATLNAGGTVIRYYNIPEACGNVFRLWESLPQSEPIPVTDCWRYFVPMSQAVDATLEAALLPTGRYAPDPGEPVWIPALAARLYPHREQRPIPRRRGDRTREPLHASCETVLQLRGSLLRIIGAHDPLELSEAA